MAFHLPTCLKFNTSSHSNYTEGLYQISNRRTVDMKDLVVGTFNKEKDQEGAWKEHCQTLLTCLQQVLKCRILAVLDIKLDLSIMLQLQCPLELDHSYSE